MTVLIAALAAHGTDGSLSKGFNQLELALGDGQPIRCSVWAPKLDEGSSVPLVLALHYGGQVTPFYSMGYLQALVVPGLKKLGAVIVAPDSPGNGWTDLFVLNAAGPSGAMAFALALLYGVRTDAIAPVIVWTSTLSLISLSFLA